MHQSFFNTVHVFHQSIINFLLMSNQRRDLTIILGPAVPDLLHSSQELGSINSCGTQFFFELLDLRDDLIHSLHAGPDEGSFELISVRLKQPIFSYQLLGDNGGALSPPQMGVRTCC